IQINNNDEFIELTLQNKMDQPFEGDVQSLLTPFQKNEELLNHSGGSGLGLAVVKSITNYLKGSLSLKIVEDRFQVQLRLPHP
ncbi:MAG: GHKL domain-containing protein, partial [Pseudomonadota bacterium]